MKTYFVTKNGQQLGPFSLQKIVDLLGSSSLKLTDYIFDEDINDWVLLLSHKVLTDFLEATKPSTPPPVTKVSSVIINTDIEDIKSETNEESEPKESSFNDELTPIEYEELIQKTAVKEMDGKTNVTQPSLSKVKIQDAFDSVSNCVYQTKLEEIKKSKGSEKEKAIKFSRALEEVTDPIDSEWFVLKDSNEYGPYTYPEMIKMLQQKTIYAFDFVWHKSLSHWRRISELEAFSYESVAKLENTFLPETTQVLIRRRHKRVNYGHSILVHDNRRVWKAQSVQIGKGGVGVVMTENHVVTGQTVYLHFQPGDGVPPFNAVCEVVTKRLHEPKKAGEQVKVFYGMKFQKISKNISQLVESLTKKAS